MNHSLVFNSASRDGDSYWEEAIALAVHLGSFLQALVIPLLLLIGVQFTIQLYSTIRREALRQLQQHVDALHRDRQRLIEEIKLDLLRTLNKGTKEPDAASDVSLIVSAKIPEKECEKPAAEKRLTSSLRAKNDGTTGRSNQSTVKRRPTAALASSNTAEWATPRRLDRKECSNIVNEIIYQIQSGTRNAEDGIRPAKSAIPEEDNKGETRGGNAEDSAVLRDVHRRNVVARMKTLFEQPTIERPKTSVKLRSSVTPEKQPPATEATLRHYSSVVNILRRTEPTSYPSRTISASLENLRPTGGGPFLKASSEPPTVIRLRRRIRSQHSLTESVEDILETERFSKRLSQYSISDLLDEEDDDSRKRNSTDRYGGGEVKTSNGVPYDRVSRGLKTLSTFSLSELLQDEESVDGTEETEVVLRRSKATSAAPPAAYRNAVDNIEQILIAENLSKDYWKYSISNLLDCMEEEEEKNPLNVVV